MSRPTRKEADPPGSAPGLHEDRGSLVQDQQNATGAPKEDFGPFLQVPSRDIHETSFDCPSCGNRVRKFLQFFPQVADFMSIYVCGCTSVAVWELEAPPTCSEHWERLTQLQKRNDRDIIILLPEAAAELHSQRNN